MPPMHAADGRDGYLLLSLFLQLPGLLVLRPLHHGADERQMSGMQTGLRGVPIQV